MESEWQFKFKTIKERNAQLFATGLRADCSFRAIDISENEQIFPAHKIILSIASPVFDRMFFGSIPEKADVPIFIEGIEASDFYDLLYFVYCDTVTISSMEKAQNLYYAAQKYMLDQLTKCCITFIIKNLQTDNVLSALTFAYVVEDECLEAACLELIRTHTSAVLLSPAFFSVDLKILNTILDQSHLSINSELELFNALNEYAKFNNYFISYTQEKQGENAPSTFKSNCLIAKTEQLDSKSVEEALNTKEMQSQEMGLIVTTTGVSKENTSSVTTESKRLTPQYILFQKIVKKIRFLTMSTAEFASGPAISKLLLTEDALAIFACIAKPSLIEVYFPKGFVNLRKKRTNDPYSR